MRCRGAAAWLWVTSAPQVMKEPGKGEGAEDQRKIQAVARWQVVLLPRTMNTVRGKKGA